MATILKDVPPGYNWGWHSREDPRMHLQPVDKEHKRLRYKVSLERDGHRVIEPEPGIPAKIWKPLQAEIAKRRDMIEDYWLSHMMERDWIELHVANPIVTIVAYPRLPHRFVRIVDLREHIENAETRASITLADVVFNKDMAALEIFPKRPEGRRHHIELVPFLWE